MVTQLNTKRILIYLAFTFGIPWTTTLVLFLSGVLEKNPAQVIGLINLAFIAIPALANVATRLVTREGWGHLWLRPNFRRGWRFYLAAWILPILAMIAGCLVFYLLFPRSFDNELAQMWQASERSVLGIVPSNPWTLVLSVTLESMIMGLILNSVLSIGEEFGWRAYLLQKLMDRFHSARKAALLVGVIHGVWHWPLNLAVFLFVTPFFGSVEPFIFVLIYPISTISMGILLAWVTLRSGSVWPAAVGHGLVMVSMGLAASVLKGLPILLLGPGMNGLIGGLGFLALALVLYFNRRTFAEEKEAGSESVRAVVGAENV